jgi:4-hydroxybenzoate polyprenyltransferase
MKIFFLALRPKQWVKNVFVLAALIFARQLTEPQQVLKSFLALIIFCFLASSGYLINDLVDLERDRRHPVKARRPLAAGLLAPATAGFISVLLGALGLLSGFLMGINFFYVALIYLTLHIIYSLVLKKEVILDMLVVSIFYVLRVIAGGVVINVYVSPWLLVCTFFLALFITVSKRRHELVLLQDEALSHREVLKEYSPQLLDQILSIVTPSTLVAYSLYTFASGHSANMIYTIPFVVYGLLRYLYLVYQKEAGGQPTEIFLYDWPLKISILLWLIFSIYIFYS